MSLWLCVESIKTNNRTLSILRSGLKYRIVYETNGQRLDIKDNITDIGYANYLYNILKDDLGFNKDDEIVNAEDNIIISGALKSELSRIIKKLL